KSDFNFMKVLFITYSLTGNTLFVAESIGKILKEQYGHTVTFIDAANIIKSAKFGRTHKTVSEGRILDCKELQELRTQLAQTDILGVGCFVSCHLPEIGFEEIFDPNVLSSDLFTNLKFFFSYTTHGSVPHPVSDVLATIINRRSKATYLGHLNVRAPENVVLLQPPQGFHDAWDDNEIARIEPFAKNIGEQLKNPGSIKGVEFKTITNIDYSMQLTMDKFAGKAQVDQSKCKKCKTCVKLCPYDAIKIGSSGFPEFDASICLWCSRCYNKCPNEAIDFPKSYGAQRSKYPKPDFTKAGVGDGKNSKGEIMTPLPQPQEIFARMQWKPCLNDYQGRQNCQRLT
ncbi:MAG: hypothetical protein EZS28_042047, partial [Streblomastix strix]